MPTRAFYLTAAELRRWLAATLGRRDVWCQLRDFSTGYRELSARDAEDLDFEVVVSAGFDIYLGNRALSDGPTLSGPGPIPRVDTAESCAVQFYPCCTAASGRSMLEGWLAAFPASRFPEPDRARVFMSFFNGLRRSLKALGSRTHVVAQRIPGGRIKRWPGIVLGQGVNHAQVRLEQTLNGVALVAIERTTAPVIQ
jgi:hypothetical protein